MNCRAININPSYRQVSRSHATFNRPIRLQLICQIALTVLAHRRGPSVASPYCKEEAVCARGLLPIGVPELRPRQLLLSVELMPAFFL